MEAIQASENGQSRRRPVRIQAQPTRNRETVTQETNAKIENAIIIKIRFCETTKNIQIIQNQLIYPHMYNNYLCQSYNPILNNINQI